MRPRSLQSYFVVALLAAAFAGRGFSQQAVPAASTALADKPAAAGPAAAPEAAATAHATTEKGKDAAGRDTLSVDFPDEDIRNILRNVSDLFELNIIMPETLQGKTTIKLRDVTWRQIFQNVLDPVNYTYIEDGNIIKIVGKDSLNEEPVTTEVFLINYARAADILPTITTLVDPAKGKIVVDTRSNSLVITERPTRMGRIRPIIEQLDRATDQVMIETKFVEVTDTDVKNIGVNWASLANYKIGAGPFNGDFSRTRGQTGSNGVDSNNGTIVNGVNGTNATNTTTIQNVQSGGTTNNGQVSSTNGVVTNTSSTNSTGALTNSTTTDGVNGTNNTFTETANNALNLLNSITNTADTTRSMTAVFSADQFQLVLSALQTQNETKIVSNPTVVTLNNTEAVINVGQERPIPRYQYNQQTGNLEVNGFDFKPIGVILKVTPQVNSRGFIKLTVAPEVSQSLNSVTFNGNAIPIIDTRKASTQVSLKDGFTMGIGGLITTSTGNGVNKVPVLGSLPVFGRLFRSDNKRHESTNLIIFITAKTISAEGASVEQVFNSERVRQLKLKREDLPGYRDGSNPYVTDPAPASSSRSATPEANK